MPLHDSRRNESHRSVKGVPEAFFFRRGLLWALLPTSAPVRRSLSSFTALAATTLITTTNLTATATLIATTTLRFTTFRLTPNGRMGVIAWRTGLTRPKGAIGDTPINMVVHIHLFTLFPMFGRWRFRPGVGGFLRRGFRVTHGVEGGVSGFGGVRVRRSIGINCIHRGFIVGGDGCWSPSSCLLYCGNRELPSPRRLYWPGGRYLQAATESYVAPLS